MLYLISAIGAFAGFLFAALMAVTVIGVCRFGEGYRLFFEHLRSLGILASVQKIAGIYLIALNKFLGPKVGFKQPGIKKAKLFGWYLEHLLLIYWFVATTLVLSFRPVDPQWESSNSLLQAGAFAVLLTVNVASDAISLLWTKRCIAYIVSPRKGRLTAPGVIWLLVQDILVAVVLMCIVQLISNGLYSLQIGRPNEFFSYMFDLCTAFKPYAPVDPRFSHLQFPGQLLITCSTYLPSILFYLSCLIVVLLAPLAKISFWILDLLSLRTGAEGCTQVGFISSLAAVSTIASGFFITFISTLLLILSR